MSAVEELVAQMRRYKQGIVAANSVALICRATGYPLDNERIGIAMGGAFDAQQQILRISRNLTLDDFGDAMQQAGLLVDPSLPSAPTADSQG